MTKDQLNLMASNLEIYIKDKDISQNKLAEKIGVASSYITHALKRNWEAIPRGGGKTSDFSEQAARQIMSFLGMNSDVWETQNFMQASIVLGEAKRFKEHRIISGQKGSGKTFTINEFKRQYPNETFVIKCKNTMTQKGFAIALAREIGIAYEGKTAQEIVVNASDKLRRMKHPTLIIDEAETLKIGSYGILKDLYDDEDLFKRIGMVLVGANDYFNKLLKLANKGKHCFPQLLSRFSSDPCILSDMSKKDVKYVCNLNGITDSETINYFYDKSGDYRELDRDIKRWLRDQQLKVA